MRRCITMMGRIGLAFLILGLVLTLYCAVIGKLGEAKRDRQAEKAGLAKQTLLQGRLCHGDVCEPAVLLTGYISHNFAEVFAQSDPKIVGPAKWICLNSPGGDPFAAVHLAKQIQELDKGTCVVPAFSADLQRMIEVRCASACAFSFIGGAQRVLANETSLGVHRVSFAEGEWCIPCNFAFGKVVHSVLSLEIYASFGENSMLSQVHQIAQEYPERYDARPSVVHWVNKAEFVDLNLGAAENFSDTWRFIASPPENDTPII